MINFSSIDPYSDEFMELDERTQEAIEFFQGMDWEGGIQGLWGHGGEEDFPEELRPLAREYGAAYKRLNDAIVAWGEERGVQY